MNDEQIGRSIGTALLIWFVWWLVRRRKKKKLAKMKEQQAAAERKLFAKQREALPGFDVEGEELAEYIGRLVEVYVTLDVLPKFSTQYLAGHGLPRSEKRIAARTIDVIRESASIIETSAKFETIKSRLGVIFSCLDRLIESYSSMQAKAARELLEEAVPRVYTIGYFREIQTSLNKISTLKTPKAQLRHYAKIEELAGEIYQLDYASDDEVDALERFCAAHTDTED